MDVQNIRSVDGEDRRWKLFHHHRENRQALKCPRCDSLDTKFCYYNNYNFSQPRHFCKTCRRYWTIGGILRNVPVGGGSRKSKNSKVKPALVGTSLSSNSNLNSHALGNTPTDNASGLGTDAPSALPSSTVMNSLSVDESQHFVAETATTFRTQESDFGMSSKRGSLRSLARSSNERSVPFVFSYIQGATPLKLSDYCDWIEEKGEVEALQWSKVVEKDGEDESRMEGMMVGTGDRTRPRGGEDEASSWLKHYGLTAHFNN